MNLNQQNRARILSWKKAMIHYLDEGANEILARDLVLEGDALFWH
jgi:hypothetical protein